eukprot:scaffold164178_cov32-Tisochrysis_lutea.AAC.2
MSARRSIKVPGNIWERNAKQSTLAATEALIHFDYFQGGEHSNGELLRTLRIHNVRGTLTLV